MYDSVVAQGNSNLLIVLLTAVLLVAAKPFEDYLILLFHERPSDR